MRDAMKIEKYKQKEKRIVDDIVIELEDEEENYLIHKRK